MYNKKKKKNIQTEKGTLNRPGNRGNYVSRGVPNEHRLGIKLQVFERNYQCFYHHTSDPARTKIYRSNAIDF